MISRELGCPPRASSCLTHPTKPAPPAPRTYHATWERKRRVPLQHLLISLFLVFLVGLSPCVTGRIPPSAHAREIGYEQKHQPHSGTLTAALVGRKLDLGKSSGIPVVAKESGARRTFQRDGARTAKWARLIYKIGYEAANRFLDEVSAREARFYQWVCCGQRISKRG